MNTWNWQLPSLKNFTNEPDMKIEDDYGYAIRKDIWFAILSF